jgi:ABC-type sulfate transport system permease component
MEVWHITWLTILTAAAATLLMVPPGLFLAWVLARRTFPGRLLL